MRFQYSHALRILALSLQLGSATALGLEPPSAFEGNSADYPAPAELPALPPPPAAIALLEPPSARESIALLLPQTGPYEELASHVLDGFFAAYFDTPEPRPDVRVYDTGLSRRSMLSAYDHALLDGATLVVGPLIKRNVQALADMRRISVPTLSLNYLDNSIGASSRFHQMGLAPEDEAMAAAESAIKHGLRRSIAVLDSDPRSRRIFLAFRQRFSQLGGTVVGVASLPSEVEDYLPALRQLPGFRPSGRSNAADMAFIAVDADASRVLMPEFRFLSRSPLPVFATSMAFDRYTFVPDRNGLRFCDAPLLLEPEGPLASWRDSFTDDESPTRFSRLRLMGLGKDAFEIGRGLRKGDLSRNSVVNGATGTLIMRADGRVQRYPACATVSSGRLTDVNARN